MFKVHKHMNGLCPCMGTFLTQRQHNKDGQLSFIACPSIMYHHSALSPSPTQTHVSTCDHSSQTKNLKIKSKYVPAIQGWRNRSGRPGSNCSSKCLITACQPSSMGSYSDSMFQPFLLHAFLIRSTYNMHCESHIITFTYALLLFVNIWPR